MTVKLSDYVADFLVKSGIEDVFMVTGGGAMHLNDSLGHKEGLKCTFNHHEQGSAIAAEGYTRLTGKLCAVNVTSGPGGTNALTGVLGGWLDSIPMFIISGQVKRETTTWSTDVPLRQLGDQEYQIVESVKPMTKYAVMVTEPNEIAYHLEKALYAAKTGRGGPVWLDIPLDVQAAKIDPETLVHFDPDELSEKPAEIPQKTIQAAYEKIKNAKRPVIIAGTGIRLSGAYDTFVNMVDALGIPVVTAWNAHDVLPDDHPLFCGRPGTVGTRGGNFVMENADLILSIGCRLNIRQISYNYKDFAKNAYKITVDIDKNELNKPTLCPDMKICGDAADFMAGMLDIALKNGSALSDASWLKRAHDVNVRYPAVLCEYKKTDKPLNPYVFMDGLFRALPENEVVVCGNGSACVIGFQSAIIKKGQRLFTNSGCASMGYGLPAALGAAIARRGERVVCLDGDGSLMMNIQELQTISYNKLNFKLFVLNNNGYHSIRQTQTNLFKEHCLCGVSEDNGVSFPSFEKIADAFGFKYFKVDAMSTMKESIEAALSADGPVLCEAFLDDKQFFAPKLSSRVNPDGTIVSPPIDDMYPFLPREEYEENKVH